MQVITLPGITLFWQDLGLPGRSKMTLEDDKWMAGFWDEHLAPWIEANVRDDCNPWENGIWFANPREAMLFKLTWSGQIPLPR